MQPCNCQGWRKMPGSGMCHTPRRGLLRSWWAVPTLASPICGPNVENFEFLEKTAEPQAWPRPRRKGCCNPPTENACWEIVRSRNHLSRETPVISAPGTGTAGMDAGRRDGESGVHGAHREAPDGSVVGRDAKRRPRSMRLPATTKLLSPPMTGSNGVSPPGEWRTGASRPRCRP